MTWRKWKRGLLIAMFTGFLTGVVGMVVGITWQQACILMAVSVAKDTLLWLKDHPVEHLADTTTFLKRGRASSISPPAAPH